MQEEAVRRHRIREEHLARLSDKENRFAEYQERRQAMLRRRQNEVGNQYILPRNNDFIRVTVISKYYSEK